MSCLFGELYPLISCLFECVVCIGELFPLMSCLFECVVCIGKLFSRVVHILNICCSSHSLSGLMELQTASLVLMNWALK